jgi:putative inorganic carbon (HCO3(-)) transporter
VTAFIIAALASIAFSGASVFGLYEFLLFIPNFLLFYLASRLTPRERRELTDIIVIVGILIGFYALYQYFFGLRHTLEYIKRTQPNLFAEEFLGRMRVFATFVSPNIFASYIAMVLFIVMGAFVSYARRERIICIFCILVMALALILTKSLGGILTFALVIPVFLFFVIFLRAPGSEPKKIFLRKIVFGAVLVIICFIVVSGLVMRQRIGQLADLQNPGNSFTQRLYYWQASLRMAKEHPLTGVGWRQFGLNYKFYKVPSANMSNYAHNAYLQVLAETGIPGCLFLLLTVFIFFKRGLKAIRECGNEQGLKIGLFCAGIAFLAHNLFEASFYFGQVSFLWWLILGMFA